MSEKCVHSAVISFSNITPKFVCSKFPQRFFNISIKISLKCFSIFKFFCKIFTLQKFYKLIRNSFLKISINFTHDFSKISLKLKENFRSYKIFT